MVAICDLCDREGFNSIFFVGTRKLRKTHWLLCREHNEVFQDKLVEVFDGLIVGGKQ